MIFCIRLSNKFYIESDTLMNRNLRYVENEMAYTNSTSLLAHTLDNGADDGVLLGFELYPGCNMKEVAGRYCPGCAITLRKERDQDVLLETKDYLQCIDECLTEGKLWGSFGGFGTLQGCTLVGDEVLWRDIVFQDRTLPILKHLKKHSIPSAIVTNGFLLHERLHDLLDVDVDHITVSLDGVRADNDALRGGYEYVIDNLVKTHRALGKKLSIGSVVHPKRYRNLGPLLDVLKRFDIRTWTLSTFIDFKKGAQDIQYDKQVLDYINELGKKARTQGIRVLFEYPKNEPVGFNVEVVRKPESMNIYRLSHDGTVQTGTNLYEAINGNSSQWTPSEGSFKDIARCAYQSHLRLAPRVAGSMGVYCSAI
mgnify:CR=1 FL=1